MESNHTEGAAGLATKGRIGPSDWTVIPFLAISPSQLYLVGFSSSSQTNQSLINSLIRKRAESHLDSNWMQELQSGPPTPD